MTKPLLKARNIFIDTQTFVRQGLRFDHPALKRLGELGSSMMLNIILSDVVVAEVQKKIRERIQEAHLSLDRFHKKAAIIEAFATDGIKHLFSVVEEQELIKIGDTLWDSFVEKSKVTILNANEINNEKLLNLYFQGQPPFSSSKKSEFPDAIMLLSLEKWQELSGENIYVISGDGDVEEWCKNKGDFHHIKTLNKFIDIYNRAEEELTELVHKLYEKEEDWIISLLKDSFTECGFDYVADSEADVENVVVTNIDVFDVSVIEVDKERAVVTINSDIDFTADVSGSDYDSAIWDSEDKEYAYLPTFNTNISESGWHEISFEMLAHEGNYVILTKSTGH